MVWFCFQGRGKRERRPKTVLFNYTVFPPLLVAAAAASAAAAAAAAAEVCIDDALTKVTSPNEC